MILKIRSMISGSKLLSILSFFILLVSCSKEDKKKLPIQGVVGPKLIRTVSNGPASGVQFESRLTYDQLGRIKSENTGYANYIAEYNDQSQIALVTQTNDDGSKAIHSVIYDDGGKIIKKTVTDQSGVKTINYTYSKDKCTGYNGADEGSVELIWEGDNVVERIDKAGSTVWSRTAFMNYDDKISPYYNIKDFIQITRLSVSSKNSPRQISSTVTQNTEFVYEYNADGSVSQIVSPSSGLATRYYYMH